MVCFLQFNSNIKWTCTELVTVQRSWTRVPSRPFHAMLRPKRQAVKVHVHVQEMLVACWSCRSPPEKTTQVWRYAGTCKSLGVSLVPNHMDASVLICMSCSSSLSNWLEVDRNCWDLGWRLNPKTCHHQLTNCTRQFDYKRDDIHSDTTQHTRIETTNITMFLDLKPTRKTHSLDFDIPDLHALPYHATRMKLA